MKGDPGRGGGAVSAIAGEVGIVVVNALRFVARESEGAVGGGGGGAGRVPVA